MDKSWIHLCKNSQAYDDGVFTFLEYAYAHGYVNNEGHIRCPCVDCKNFNFIDRETIYEHLVCKGMLGTYTIWIHHGETIGTTSSSSTIVENRERGEDVTDDDINGMLQDLFPNVNEEIVEGLAETGMNSSNIAGKFHKFLEEAKKPLYPGCEKKTMLAFLIRMWHFKCLGGWSNKTFSMMLELLRESLPDGCTLPENFTQCKKVISDLGLTYEKIDACENDCMLFWKENSDLQSCTFCGASRWKVVRSRKKKNTPVKILHYFPLKPRLQRMYMSSKVAEDMRWHEEGRTKDGVLRHLADSLAWKHFDEKNPMFARDLRNVRLGVASDGFNPFRTMSCAHNTWPVILIPYNLPPWLCMKQPHMILSLIIPGPKSPGNDIDVYLRPLIEELKELWEEGVETYDSYTKEMFTLHAGILWTISDFPGLAMLSGWSTKGFMPCPTCHKHTRSRRLKNWKKICYMGHRRWLPMNHRLRKLRKEFDGATESETPPPPLLGNDVLEKLKGIPHKFGKKPVVNDTSSLVRRKRPREWESLPSMPDNWKKLNIWYELPNWADNLLKHNLDVMHIEKNVFDNIMGTLLDIDKKTSKRR